MTRIVLLATLAVGMGAPAICAAQAVVAPGQKAREAAEGSQGPGGSADEPYQNAYDAPPVVVVGHRPGLKEEDRIGDYAQPRWTARRRFPTTRVYVRPKGQFAFEYWLRSTHDLEHFSKASAKTHRSIYEWEWGLGERLQLDLYLVMEQAGHGPVEIHKESIELRYALADWGVIWGNPTLYLEYGREGGGGPFVEGKLLLGGELGRGWHGGLNLVLEKALTDAETHEYKVTGGLSRTVVDSRFSVGAEAEVELVDDKANRFDFLERKYVVGPSLSWQPTKHINLLLTPLFGVAEERTAGGDYEGVFIWQNWLVAGWTY